MITDLSKVTRYLLMNEGFYGLLLVGMRKDSVKGDHPMCPTACVYRQPNSINIDLLINEDFWAKWPPDRRWMLLKHELLHVALGHLFMHDLMPDTTISSIAVDIAVNQYIPGIEKNTGEIKGVCYEDFPQFKMEKFKGATYYYDILKKMAGKKQSSADKGEPNLRGEPGKGTSGNQILDDAIENKQNMHKMWDALKNMSDAEKKMVEKQVGTMIKNVAEEIQKQRGTTPAELDEIIKRLFEIKPPVIDWKGYLRRFAGNALSQEIKRTRMKENIRFPSQPAIKTKKKIRICMAIDESGSMSDRDIMEINNEMYHQWKAGAEITILHWDTNVHAVEKYDGKLEIKRHCGGGTRMGCAIEYINEHRKDFTVAFIGTDLYVESDPPKCQIPMMILVTSSGNKGYSSPYPIVPLEHMPAQ